MTDTSSKMRNVQVIDGAINCTYDIFQIDYDGFKVLFPAEGQDIEFSEDFTGPRKKAVQEVCKRMWKARLDKKHVKGIHGTIFYGLEEKRRFYPNKLESDLDARMF